jgi:hypothetical protein
MLLVVDFPICDARSLSGAAESRLVRPNWPPTTGTPRQFVRKFGQATRRRRGADAAWVDEYAYIDARRAISFEALTNHSLGQSPSAVPLEGVFRRLLCDRSRTTARVEIGLALRRKNTLPPLDGTGCGALVEAVLSTPAPVPSPNGESRALGACGPRLAALYARSTTKWSSALADASQHLVQAGQPVVVVEFAGTEEWEMPDWAAVVPPEAVNGARVGYGRVGRYAVGTWFIGGGPADPSQLRSLRLCLLRLHAMQQVLDGVLRQLDNDEITYEPYTTAGDRLSDFLNDMTTRIGARSAHGVSQSAIVNAMDASVSVSAPGEGETRIANLDSARRQVAAKVRSYLQRRKTERVVNTFIEGDTVSFNTNFNGPVTGSSVIIGQTLDNAQVSIRNSAASDELKASLTALMEQVRQLIAQLPDDESKAAAAKAAKDLAAAAVESSPTELAVRKAGDVLIQAGNKVQKFAEPIAAAVSTVFKLLKLAVPGI